jgi:hypothetical protein
MERSPNCWLIIVLEVFGHELPFFVRRKRPALILYPQGAELAREAEASMRAGDLPGPLAGLVQNYIEGRFSDRDELAGTLYLNTSNAVIRRLVEVPLAPAVMACVLDLLLPMARLFAGRMLSAADAVEAFAEVTRSLEG